MRQHVHPVGDQWARSNDLIYDDMLIVEHRDVPGLEHVLDGSDCPCLPVIRDREEPYEQARARQEGEA